MPPCIIHDVWAISLDHAMVSNLARRTAEKHEAEGEGVVTHGVRWGKEIKSGK
jgi:hypothetical protein